MLDTCNGKKSRRFKTVAFYCLFCTSTRKKQLLQIIQESKKSRQVPTCCFLTVGRVRLPVVQERMVAQNTFDHTGALGNSFELEAAGRAANELCLHVVLYVAQVDRLHGFVSLTLPREQLNLIQQCTATHSHKSMHKNVHKVIFRRE